MDTDDDIQQLLSVCSGEWVDGGVDFTHPFQSNPIQSNSFCYPRSLESYKEAAHPRCVDDIYAVRHW